MSSFLYDVSFEEDGDLAAMLSRRTCYPVSMWRRAVMMLENTPGGIRVHLPTVLELIDTLLIDPVDAVLAVRGSLDIH